MKRIKTITICSSADFYKDVLKIEEKLKKMGYKVLIPVTAKKMKKTGNFNAGDYKTWYKNNADYTQKKKLMDTHFKKVENADAILVVNKQKHGITGYIGGNVLMEMTLAYHLKKTIFILHPISDTLSFKEEIFGIFPSFLHGDVENIQPIH